MHHLTVGQSMALGAMAIIGVAGTFIVGASAGAALNGHINSTSVARIPLRELQQHQPSPPPAPAPPPPPPALATK